MDLHASLDGCRPVRPFPRSAEQELLHEPDDGIEESDEEGGEGDGDDFDEAAFAAMRDDGILVLEKLRNVLGQAARMLHNTVMKKL